MMSKKSSSEVIYANRPLERVFLNHRSRVLDFLILNEKFDYSVLEISNITLIPIRTLQHILACFVEKELVKETVRLTNEKRYIINAESDLVTILKQYVHVAINEDINRARQRQILRNSVLKSH